MPRDKIYIRMIDGSNTLVPVNAEQINDKLFIILNDEEYSDPDPSVLFEFYPGDIVEVADTENLDNEYQYAAKRLIKPATTDDRDYHEFKFYATFWHLPIDKQTADRFRPIVERIRQESKEGKFFYRGILDTANRLFQL
ncbi:MAG: hypothetical protein JWQ40_4237 [Segetibacter sp.]|nr:hypothetical protein [Segetibacter sp.]